MVFFYSNLRTSKRFYLFVRPSLGPRKSTPSYSFCNQAVHPPRMSDRPSHQAGTFFWVHPLVQAVNHVRLHYRDNHLVIAILLPSLASTALRVVTAHHRFCILGEGFHRTCSRITFTALGSGTLVTRVYMGGRNKKARTEAGGCREGGGKPLVFGSLGLLLNKGRREHSGRTAYHHGTGPPSHVHIFLPCVSLVAASITWIIPVTLWSTVMAAFSSPKDSAPKLPRSVWTQLKKVSDNSHEFIDSFGLTPD